MTIKIGLILILGGVGIWIWQAYEWLKYGEWNSISLLHIFEYKEWMIDWIGFEKLLDFIPISVVLIGFGLLMYLAESD